ncbi:MAG: type III-B CRISPR module RAMP protein Cmr4 [Desulfurococcaceae archaeon]
MYSDARLLYVRAYTPLHVGVGRGEEAYVDLPIQRDEYGYPVIWSSSFKGAIKANLDSNAKQHLGSEPGVSPSKPSAAVFLDARLLLIPVRVINKVWAYATSINMLNTFNKYIEVINSMNKQKQDKLNQLNLSTISRILREKPVVSKGDLVYNGKVMVNEIEFKAEIIENILETTGLADILHQEIKNLVEDRGLIILPDKDNIDIRIINRSIVIQYRVRLGKEKVVEEGALWNEEYVPMESVFASVILCRNAKYENVEKDASQVCNDVVSQLDNRFIYVGGKESIGKGLIKLYVFTK